VVGAGAYPARALGERADWRHRSQGTPVALAPTRGAWKPIWTMLAEPYAGGLGPAPQAWQGRCRQPWAQTRGTGSRQNPRQRSGRKRLEPRGTQRTSPRDRVKRPFSREIREKSLLPYIRVRPHG
jgi:hypothetical protein